MAFQILGTIGLCETIFELLFIFFEDDLKLFKRVLFTYIAFSELIGEAIFLVLVAWKGRALINNGDFKIVWRMVLKDPIHNMAYPQPGMEVSCSDPFFLH